MSYVAFFWCMVALVLAIAGLVATFSSENKRKTAANVIQLNAADKREGCGCILYVIAAAAIVAAIWLLLLR